PPCLSHTKVSVCWTLRQGRGRTWENQPPSAPASSTAPPPVPGPPSPPPSAEPPVPVVSSPVPTVVLPPPPRPWLRATGGGVSQAATATSESSAARATGRARIMGESYHL